MAKLIYFVNKKRWVALLCLSGNLVACGFSVKYPDVAPHIAGKSDFNAESLCTVASDADRYIHTHPDDTYAVHQAEDVAIRFGLAALEMGRVVSTLQFICEIENEDKLKGRDSRLKDAEFLRKNFDFYLWSPDKETAVKIAGKSNNQKKADLLRAIPDDKLLLTKYYTKLLNGRAQRGGEFTQALYALPYDEHALSEAQIQERKTSLTRFKYTRSDIINGALRDKKWAEPLIWLTEAALHDVLLQGTGVIDDSKTLRYFNVHKNNGIAYDYSLGKNEQERYWYFAEVDGILGYGKKIEEKIHLIPGVSLAGDVEQLGLGKVFLIQYPVDGVIRKRIAVLADEGGAFKNNVFQLDLLVDSYYGWDDYYAANKHMPDYAEVWLMLKK